MPDIRIRWADNTQDLTRHLKEGLNQIEATKASAEKMVQAMGGDKLMRAAHTWVAAVTQMGGAEKLTNAERERGIALLERAIEKYRVLGKEAPSALLATLNQTKALNQPLSQMVQGMNLAGQQATASGKMLAGMGDSGRLAMTGIATSTASTVGPMTSMLGLAKSLGPALGIGFGVGAVVNFGKSVIADADALTKMSDKTGISIQGLQKFQIVADDAGNTIDQLTTATNQMQNRLAGNDQSAVAAIDKLGLRLSDLKRLSPEQQFMAIADAIRDIQDPAQQVNVAMDIFGRSGAEILPTIKRGFDDVKDAAVGMSDETVKALAAVDDAWKRFLRETKSNVGTFLAETIPIVERAWLLANILAGRGGTPIVEAVTPGALPKPAGSPNFGTPPAIQPIEPPPNLATAEMFDERMRRTQTTFRDTGTASRALADDLKEQADAWDFVQRSQAEAMAGAVTSLQRGTAGQTDFMKQWQAAQFLREQTAGTVRLDSRTTATSFAGQMSIPGAGMEQFNAKEWAEINGKTAGAQFKTTLEGSLSGLNGIFQRAFEGGGGWKGALKSFATDFTAGLANMIPVIGPIVSQFMGAIVAGFTKLFGGPSKQELEGREVKKEFQDSFGSFEDMLGAVNDAYLATGRSSEMARRDVLRLMEAEKQGAEAVKKVRDEINKAFQEREAQWEATATAVSDLTAFVADGVNEQGRYNIAVGSAVAIFDAWVKKTGDVAGALEQIGPALDAIGKAQTDMGFAGNAAIDQLLGLRKVTQANKGLMDQIGQSTRLITSLGKAGLLTEELLMSFGQNAVNQFTVLKGKTGDAKTAMVLMQPELQALWEHQEKFGEFADEATQALIDQAREAGIVGPEMKSDQDKLLDVMKEIRDTLYTIAGIEIPDKTFKVKQVNVVEDGGWTGGTGAGAGAGTGDGGGDGTDDGDFDRGAGGGNFGARGGLVTRFGIQQFAGGGLVKAIRGSQWPTDFAARGTDTVRAMLSPGELVLTQAHQANLAGALQAGAGHESQAVVTELRALRQDIQVLRHDVQELQTVLRDRPDTVVAIDGREVARANVKAWDNGDASLTVAREILGVS